MNNLSTIIIAIDSIGYALFNILTERPITQRDLKTSFTRKLLERYRALLCMKGRSTC